MSLLLLLLLALLKSRGLQSDIVSAITETGVATPGVATVVVVFLFLCLFYCCINDEDVCYLLLMFSVC